jgi:hypothetical protein
MILPVFPKVRKWKLRPMPKAIRPKTTSEMKPEAARIPSGTTSSPEGPMTIPTRM